MSDWLQLEDLAKQLCSSVKYIERGLFMPAMQQESLTVMSFQYWMRGGGREKGFFYVIQNFVLGSAAEHKAKQAAFWNKGSEMDLVRKIKLDYKYLR